MSSWGVSPGQVEELDRQYTQVCERLAKQKIQCMPGDTIYIYETCECIPRTVTSRQGQQSVRLNQTVRMMPVEMQMSVYFRQRLWGYIIQGTAGTQKPNISYRQYRHLISGILSFLIQRKHITGFMQGLKKITENILNGDS